MANVVEKKRICQWSPSTGTTLIWRVGVSLTVWSIADMHLQLMHIEGGLSSSLGRVTKKRLRVHCRQSKYCKWWSCIDNEIGPSISVIPLYIMSIFISYHCWSPYISPIIFLSTHVKVNNGTHTCPTMILSKRFGPASLEWIAVEEGWKIKCSKRRKTYVSVLSFYLL